jgi:hypothetical protein
MFQQDAPNADKWTAHDMAEYYHNMGGNLDVEEQVLPLFEKILKRYLERKHID